MTRSHGAADPLWSELRQASITQSEARLYRERAGLEPAEAVKWWERYVFSAEAARAISEGLTVEQALERLAEWSRERAEEREAETRASAIEDLRQSLPGRLASAWCPGVFLSAGHEPSGQRVDFQLDWDVPTYVAQMRRDIDIIELGSFETLEQGLAVIAEAAREIGVTLTDAFCRMVDPVDLLRASPAFACVCGSDLVIRLEQPELVYEVPSSGHRSALDSYDGEDEDGFDGQDDGEDLVLSVHVVSSRGAASLVPDFPSEWPTYQRHSTGAISIDTLFFIADQSGAGLTLVGDYADVADGLAACTNLAT